MNWLPKLILIVGGLVGICLLVMFFLTTRIDPHHNTDWSLFSNFGEATTVVAAIWALAAVLLAYQTLEAQRSEFKNASDRFSEEQKHNLTIYRQSAFQNGFFTLLDRQREIVNALRSGQLGQEGQEQLRNIYLAYDRNYQNRRAHSPNESKYDSCKAAEISTETSYSEIRHYARSLYQLVKYVDTFANESINRREDFDSKQFIDFIQGQMSKWELMLTLVNSFNHPQMLELIKKHNLVENLKCNPNSVTEMAVKETAVSFGLIIKD